MREQRGLLTVWDRLPDGLLEAHPTELAELLGGPALLLLPGRREPPLFASVLQHGNEVSGIQAIQQVLAAHRGRELPRSLALFVGNVAAAREGLRHLDGQPDYNRVWPGTDRPESPETRMTAEITGELRRRGCFASIDVHNNSGRNPPYACINRPDPAHAALATLFSRTVVYFTRPRGVQSIAFSEFCPATVLECGPPGSPEPTARAAETIDAALRLEHLDPRSVPLDLALFHTVAVVRVNPGVDFGFGDQRRRLTLPDDLDRLNFREVPPGTTFAWVAQDTPAPVLAVDNAGQDATGRYFEIRGRALRTRREVMPVMLTLDTRVIRQDCLCYLMERLDAPELLGLPVREEQRG